MRILLIIICLLSSAQQATADNRKSDLPNDISSLKGASIVIDRNLVLVKRSDSTPIITNSEVGSGNLVSCQLVHPISKNAEVLLKGTDLMISRVRFEPLMVVLETDRGISAACSVYNPHQSYLDEEGRNFEGEYINSAAIKPSEISEALRDFMHFENQ